LFSLAVLHGRRTKLIMAASFLALVVNTILNFALIPRWGMYGAAYATCVAYAVEALVMYWLSQQTYNLDYDLSRTFAAMTVFAAVLALTQYHWNPSIRPLAMAGGLIISLGLLTALGFERIAAYFKLRASTAQ